MKINIIYFIAIITLGLNDLRAMKLTSLTPKRRSTLERLPIIPLTEILEQIPCTYLTSLTCKRFQEINKKILKKKWNYLKNKREQYFISRAINSINFPEEITPTRKDFIKLYYNLLKTFGLPKTKRDSKLHNQVIKRLSLPKAKYSNSDTTDIEFYLDIDNRMQKNQDENLMKIWPRLSHQISIENNLNINFHLNTEELTAQKIRDWLKRESNKLIIQQVTYLPLFDLGLTCIPQELELFTNLRQLYLHENDIACIKIPETLVNLHIIELCNNELLSIEIPNNLINLREIYISNNQLKNIKIPDTLIHLQTLSLRENLLNSIDIPDTLINLRRLHLNNNQLTSIEIDSKLTHLRELSLYNNKLNSIDISKTLTHLRLIELDYNNLEFINIPGSIRSHAQVYGESDQKSELPSCTIS